MPEITPDIQFGLIALIAGIVGLVIGIVLFKKLDGDTTSHNTITTTIAISVTFVVIGFLILLEHLF